MLSRYFGGGQNEDQGAGGILNNPTFRNILFGGAQGLLARYGAGDATTDINPMIQSALKERKSRQEKQKFTEMANQPGVFEDPQKMHQLALTALSSSDPKLQEFGTKLLAGGQSQMSLSVDPETGAVTFSQGTGTRGAPQSAVVGGNLVSAPGRATQSAQQKSQLTNVGREVAMEYVKHPYVGTGSNKRLLADRLQYDQEINPIKKAEIGERLVQAAVAEKALPEAVSLGLASQGLTPTNLTISHQGKSIRQGWAETLKAVSNNLPPELQQQAIDRYNDIMKEINLKRSQYYARGMPIPVGQQQQASQPQWKNRAEYQKWFLGLSPQQQQAEIMRLKRK